jgi:peptidoglycan-associated lipoprotein
MKMRFLALAAAVVLLAACESTPEGGGAATGSGQATAPARPAAPAQPMAGIQPGSPEDFIANVGDRVFFDLNKSNLKPEATATLDKQAAWLARFPQRTLTIEGHCDERGTREFNLALGERRANAVKEYLAAKGVNAARLRTISYGKERPVALGSNEAAWSQNRRGVSVVQTGPGA